MGDWRYIDADIPQTSILAERYLRATLGDARVTGYVQTRRRSVIDTASLPSASVLCS